MGASKLMENVLIIGQSGQVSTYLQERLGGDFNLEVAGRNVIDLSQPKSVAGALEKLNPSIIINPAAFTAVDLAEEESEEAFAINALSVAEISTYCRERNTPLIHFSTDYVFDGDAQTPYTETDKPAPTGVYGASKLAGEVAVIESGAPAIVLRTSWVYSNVGKNFYRTMLALAETRTELSVVADQIGSPTYAGSIADACLKIVETISAQGGIREEQVGIYHLSCEDYTSWAGFAEAIFAQTGHDNMVVNSITTAEYPTPAKRPAYSVLNGGKLAQVFDVRLPDWQQALINCIADSRS